MSAAVLARLPGPGPDVELQVWSGPEMVARVDEAMAIYVAAMGYHVSAGKARAAATRAHTRYDGFASVAAVHTPSGRLLGFGYGYTSRPGQWWHDLVRRAVEPSTAEVWMADAFELSELHVSPDAQGRGIGRAVLAALASRTTESTMLLSTPDAETRAFRLYTDLGFVALARRHRFPGDGRPFAVLGARLPFAPPGRHRTAP
ncbi:GNAT family N-acetyltransferase [Jatrophihabitans sp. YIM 134969]